jgi:hypothetical protein
VSSEENRPEPGVLRSLAGLVRSEAIRTDAEERIRPDSTRLAAGWERRFVIERERAVDLVRLYARAGLEVAVDPVPPESLADECDGCRIVFQREYVSIYTRRRAPGAGDTMAAP